MGLRIEWRSKAEGDDALLAVEVESDDVIEAWEADAASLTNFLNDMDGLDAQGGRDSIDAGQRDPENWGELVIARFGDRRCLECRPPAVLGGSRLLVSVAGERSSPVAWKPVSD